MGSGSFSDLLQIQEPKWGEAASVNWGGDGPTGLSGSELREEGLCATEGGEGGPRVGEAMRASVQG